jgi:hypothetical protein
MTVRTEKMAKGLSLVTNDQQDQRDHNRAIRVRQRAIGRELRRLYDTIASEPVPEEFLDLLREIDGPASDEGDGNS